MIVIGDADHQHRTNGGDVLPCELPYARCQGKRSDAVYVIVIEDPNDWEGFEADPIPDPGGTARRVMMMQE